MAKRHGESLDFVEKKSVQKNEKLFRLSLRRLGIIVEKFFRKVTVIQDFVARK